jgi:NADPH2:quinone reductase
VKAAVYYETGGPEVFRYEDVPDPVMAGHELLVRVEAISIEGGDTLNRTGGEMSRVPHIVGYQCAGTVVAVGDQVTQFHEGDRVVTVGLDGSHAELRSVAEPFCWKIPDGLVHRRGGLRARALRDGRRLPVRVRAPAVGGDRPHPGRGERGGDRRHPVGQAGRGPGPGHGLARREAGTTDGVRTRRGDQLRERPTSSRRSGGSPTGGVPTSSSTRWVGRPCRAASAAWPTGVGASRWATPGGRGLSRWTSPTLRPNNQSLTGYFLGAELFLSGRPHALIARHLDAIAAGTLRVVIDRRFPLAAAAAAHAYIESRQAFGRVLLPVP